MPLSWDLIIRFTLGGGQRRFTRFVALASLLGMLLGVAGAHYRTVGHEWIWW
jgi:ABC-type lipoprotein release transport system permease subunit